MYRKMLRRKVSFLFTLIFIVTLGNIVRMHIHHAKRFGVGSSQDVFFLSQISSRKALSSLHHARLKETMDWNNYTLMELDRLRVGPGEQGKPVSLALSDNESKIYQLMYQKHKFNVMASAQISLQRSIGDQRDEMCKRAKFMKHIPINSVSIIVPFHNEHNSTIFRTVFSIINRSPGRLLKEIILVDDSSTIPHLKTYVEDFIEVNDFNKVKVIRNKQRLGLMLSRIAGADVSTGQFLVFLDSHIEVNYNYLPPLIEPILRDSKTIACPIVDNISKHDFRISRIHYERNAFRWDMKNQHFRIFPQDVANLPTPISTPAMMGGAFAIDRGWWETLGKYDRGLELWGGEQYELSFKAWMCGGRIVNVPCSRVAHLFRNELPYNHVGEAYARNIKRVVTVWMDEYKWYVYNRLPDVEKASVGDISSQLMLRERLKCKGFKWYMTHIAPDVLYNWPVIEPPLLAWGLLRLKTNEKYCLKFSSKDKKYDSVFVGKCDTDAMNSRFEYSWRRTIKEENDRRCLETRNKGTVSVHHFRLNTTQQQFVWERQTGWIVSLTTGYCLHHDQEKMAVDMRPCLHNHSFFWEFTDYSSTLVDAEWNKVKDDVAIRKITPLKLIT